jgi:hypothetical protein
MNKVDITGYKDSMNSRDAIQLGSGIKSGDELILRKKHVLRALYDFSVSGGAVGAISLLDENGKAAVIPNKAIITDSMIDVITAPTSGGSATIALGANTTTDLKAATAIASYTGIVAGVPVGTAATAVKTTADRTVTATIAVAALTAGKFYVMVEYILSET